MHRQWRPAPESTYASQAARWKQGFKAPPSPLQQQQQQQQQQQPQPSVDQTDLENALVSELCSSLGSSSFPPRELLQKLLRYLHTLDHDVRLDTPLLSFFLPLLVPSVPRLVDCFARHEH